MVCTLDLAHARVATDPARLEELIARARSLESELDPSNDFEVRHRPLLVAARAIAEGSVPDARACVPAMAVLGLVSPLVGHVVLSIAERDGDLSGDAHDYALRRIAATTAADRVLALASLITFGDVVTSASLLDEVPDDHTDVLGVVWRAWTLETLGFRAEATDLLLRHVAACGVTPRRLEEMYGSVATSARGSPTRSADLFNSILDALGAEVLNVGAKGSRLLFELIDTSGDARLAESLVRIVAELAGAPLEQVAFGLAARATNDELQCAAGMLASFGYEATGDLVCADLAVWRLAAAGRNEDSVRLALRAQWTADTPDDVERLRHMYERVASIASSRRDLEEIDRRVVALGAPSRADEPDYFERRHSPEHFEFLGSVLVQKHWEAGEISRGLRQARDFTIRQRRGALPLATTVDLYIELGQFDRALEEAQALVAAWPSHPVARFKLGKVYRWLACDDDARELWRSAVTELDQYPLLAPELLDGWAYFDREDAVNRCNAALGNAAYGEAHDRLREVRDRLAAG